MQDLVRAIGESKSKQEEDRIITKEIGNLKQAFTSKDISGKKMRELVIRLMYVDMLGQDASFAFIHAVNMTQERGLHEKKTGYLAASLFLHSEHELLILLVNTIQRDLRSANPLEVCAALSAATNLISRETIPAVLPQVTELIAHKSEAVRKKAVMVLQRFAKVSPDSVEDLGDHFRRALCDPDPSVMAAALCVLHDLIKADAAPYKTLVSSFVSILKQIADHRLPRDYDYHRMPAPWIQIKLLKILSILGTADQRASEEMYEVLGDVMKRADIGINIGYAVIFECVRTITSIYPEKRLLEAAADSTSRFITSNNHNLRYIGIDALSAVVQVNPKYASEHQMVVLDCLEDPDETLKKKTLDLLFKMTNPANVVVVVEKMSSFLQTTKDVFLRRDLVSKITQLAEKYAPNNSWFITTMNDVFKQGGQLVKADVMHNLLRLIAEGTGEDESADQELRLYAVDAYLQMIDDPTIPDILLQSAVWVLGEYGYLLSSSSLSTIADKLCDLMDRNYKDADTKCWIISALAKIVAQSPAVIESVRPVAQKYTQSKHQTLQQMCAELLALSLAPPLMAAVLPVDASCEDLESDSSLAFLNAFVQAALSRGLPAYQPPADLDYDDTAAALAGESTHAQSKLKFDAYPHQTAVDPLAAAAAAGNNNINNNAAAVNPLFNFGGDPAPSSGVVASAAPEGGSIYGLDSAAAAAAKASEPQSFSAPADSLSFSSLSTALPSSTARKWTTDGYKSNEVPAGGSGLNYPKSAFSTFAGAPGDSRTSAYAQAVQDQTDIRNKAGFSNNNNNQEISSSSLASSSIYGLQQQQQQKPQVSAAKQQMAASLFAGLTTSAGAAAPAAAPAARAPLPAAAPKPAAFAPKPAVPAAAPRPSGGEGLLLDLGFGAPTPAPAPAAAPAANNSAASLEDLLFGGGPTPAAAAPAPPPSSLGGGLNLFDMPTTTSAPAPAPIVNNNNNINNNLGGGGLSMFAGLSAPPAQAAAPVTAASAAPKPAPARAAMSAFDDLLGMGGSSGGGGGIGGGAGGIGGLNGGGVGSWTPPAAIQIPPAIESQIAGPGLIRVSDSLKPLTQDASIHVSSAILLRPAESIVALAIFNTSPSSSSIQGLTIQFDHPHSFRASYAFDPAVVSVAAGTKLTVAAIQPRSAVYVLVRYTLVDLPSPGLPLTMLGKIGYLNPTSRDLTAISFSLDLPISFVFRPLPISTQEFGANWGKFGNERKVRQSTRVNSPAEWHLALQRGLQFHPVQIIGTEAIAAARVAGSEGTVLVHGRLQGGGVVETTIRSPIDKLGQVVASALQNVFN